MQVVGAWKNEMANEPYDIIVQQTDTVLRGQSIPQPPVSAAAMRRALKNAKTKDQREDIMHHIDEVAYDVGMVNVDAGGNPYRDAEAQHFYSAATGHLVPFAEHLDEWLSTSRTTAKTQDMHRSEVKRFAREFAMVQDVARPDVRRWVTKLMNENSLSPKTVQRILSALRGYWRYLQSIGVADEENEPFSKLDVARQANQASPRSIRQPFEASDVLKLLNAAIERGDDNLADLIRLGMWTGCRIEELCALKVDRVKEDYFRVEDAKTKAGWRDVPIHSELQQTMARLMEDSEDGYVLLRADRQ
jgi:integrase